jgi:hypothetical protein
MYKPVITTSFSFLVCSIARGKRANVESERGEEN